MALFTVTHLFTLTKLMLYSRDMMLETSKWDQAS